MHRMKTTLHLTLYLTLLVSSLCFLSCSDDKEAMPRLFRPSFIASSCVADGNSISLAWRTSGEPTSYTAELSEDSTFAASATLSQTVEGGKCTFDNLKYETAYYVRVRANNEAMQLVSNWTVYESTVSTLSRIVPKLLYPVDERNITDGSVLLQWTGAGEANPVDGLCVWTEEEMEAGTEGSAVSLSATDVAAGSYRLSGLSPRTVYYVALTNSQAPEGAEDYNVRRFRTGGMPAGAVSVTDGADLYARIKAGMEDASLSELVFCLQNGVDYYLNEYRRGIQRSRSEGLSPVRSTGDAFHGLGCHSNCRRCAIQHTLGYKVAQSIRDTSSDRRLSFDMGHARGRNLIQLGSGELCDGPHPNHRGIDLSRLGHVQVCPTASFRYRLSILVPVRIHCFSVRFRRCDCNDRGFQSDPCHPRGHRNRRYRHRCTSIRCDSGRDKNLRRRTQ